LRAVLDFLFGLPGVISVASDVLAFSGGIFLVSFLPFFVNEVEHYNCLLFY